jgi:hypothetical protein
VLKQLPDRIAQRVLQNATAAGARVVLKVGKQKAPKHEGRQSPASARYGTIVENLAVQNMASLKGTTGARLAGLDPERLLGEFYELGTAHQPARPFMRPGLRRDADRGREHDRGQPQGRRRARGGKAGRRIQHGEEVAALAMALLGTRSTRC